MPRQLQSENTLFEVRETELDDVTDADPSVIYVLRELTTRKWREIHKAYTRKVPNKVTRRLDDVVDDDAFADALVDYVLVDWRNVVIRGGAAAPCTTENKMLLDAALKAALIGKAGLTQVVAAIEAKDDSFRTVTDVD